VNAWFYFVEERFIMLNGFSTRQKNPAKELLNKTNSKKIARRKNPGKLMYVYAE
jgi:hypothetical protein